MRLVRYVAGGNPRIGAAMEGGVVDLVHALRHSGVGLSTATRAWLAGGADGDMTVFIGHGPDLLRDAAHAVSVRQPVVLDARLLAPISPADKFICAWVNYDNPNSHVVVPPRREPLFFSKFFSTVSGPGDPIVLPSQTRDVIPEAEIAAVIGVSGRDIARQHALDHVFGYTIVNDVTALSHSLNALTGSVGPYMMAKNFPGFAPTGPWLVTREEIADPGNLGIRCWLDDTIIVDAHSSAMLAGFPELIAQLSKHFELRCGDLIVGGGAPWLTPNPPVLHAGQRVRIACDGLGVLDNPVVASEVRHG